MPRCSIWAWLHSQVSRETVQMLDMLVVGGGYVGLAAAVAVKQAAPHLAVEVVEAAPEHVWQKDERASAIIAAAIRLLEVLDVWDEILPEAQPINRMVINDSRLEEHTSELQSLMRLSYD